MKLSRLISKLARKTYKHSSLLASVVLSLTGAILHNDSMFLAGMILVMICAEMYELREKIDNCPPWY